MLREKSSSPCEANPHRCDGVRGVPAPRALPIMHGAVSGQTFARLLSYRAFLVYASSRPIRTSETPQLVAVTTRSGSPEWELIRYQGVVSPGAYEEKTRARLGGLEPPRSHESSLALWDVPAGYRSENSWLTVCVILVSAPQVEYGAIVTWERRISREGAGPATLPFI